MRAASKHADRHERPIELSMGFYSYRWVRCCILSINVGGSSSLTKNGLPIYTLRAQTRAKYFRDVINRKWGDVGGKTGLSIFRMRYRS